MNPVKEFKLYRLWQKAQAIAKEKVSMNTKVTQYVLLAATLAGTLGVPALAIGWLHSHVAVYTGFVAAAIMLHAILPSIFAAPSAADQQATGFSSTSKVLVFAMIGVLTASTMTACNGVTVAQDIVNWTPALQSAIGVIDTTASVLDPVAAPIFTAATVGFDAASNLLVTQAKAYLANPNQTVLQELQAQVVAFQQQVNSALLKVAHISNAASQQKATADIGAVGAIVNTLLGLVESISSKAAVAQMARDSTIKLAMIEPYLPRGQVAKTVAAHYQEPEWIAGAQIDNTQAALIQAGF